MKRLLLSLGLGLSLWSCTSRELPEDPVAVSTLAIDVDGPTTTPFHVESNPIVKRNSNVDHYSSDPSVAVIPDTTTGQNALVMVSSSDLETGNIGDGWPMNQTFLYATFGTPFRDPLTTTWYDHGPVLRESQLGWAKQNANHLWAPDIQFFPGAGESAGQVWLYVPALDPDGATQRIGMTHAENSHGLYYAPFEAEANYFSILGAPNSKDVRSDGKDKVYAFDPGVFFDDVRSRYFMAYVDTGADANPQKNISFVAMNADRKSGNYLGKLGFTDPLSGYSGLKNYMEGPDIFAMWTPGANPRKYYYLIFAANVENGDNRNDTGYIGYAMCTPAAFASAPSTCWKFKGWIFRNLHTGRSNHASLVQFLGKNYVFFHRAPRFVDNVSRKRQVSVKAFEIRDGRRNNGQLAEDDGEIIGVTHPAAGDAENKPLYGTLDGNTRSVTEGFVGVQDISINTSSFATIRLSSFRNISSNDLAARGFQLFYYVNVEAGRNLRVDPSSDNSLAFKLASPPLKHIDANTWAVVLDYTGSSSVPRWTDLMGTNGQFSFHYDSFTTTDIDGNVTTDFYPLDKSNDFSQPLGDYPTFTNRVALFDLNNRRFDADNQPLPNAGETLETYEVFRTAHKDSNARFTYLTAATTNVNEGINNQYLDTGRDTQQWVIERVLDFKGLPIPAADQPKAVRLRNKQTGYYMTSNDVNRGTFAQPSFWLLDQALLWQWTTQIWIQDDAGAGFVRLRSAWVPPSSVTVSVPLFLTLTTTTNNADTNWQNVYVQPLGSNLDTRKWIAESASYKVLRTQHPDRTGLFTYLTAATTNPDEGINNQYLSTGLDTQHWVLEPVDDFSNFIGLPALSPAEKAAAVRVKNRRTGLYMTSNDVNRGTFQQPLFWLLDQALRTNPRWATQVWIKEQLGDGSVQLRNAWVPGPDKNAAAVRLFLTLNTGNNSDAGWQNVYLQPLGDNWNTQRWLIE